MHENNEGTFYIQPTDGPGQALTVPMNPYPGYMEYSPGSPLSTKSLPNSPNNNATTT